MLATYARELADTFNTFYHFEQVLKSEGTIRDCRSDSGKSGTEYFKELSKRWESMRSAPCEALRKQGYQFFSPDSSAALKPCMWCKRALAGGEMCYKHQFYGIASHRCVQMTPTLRCNQRCRFCWRSFEHEVGEEEEISPATILAGIQKLQKKALAGI